MTGDGKAIKITLGINEECVDSRSLRRHKRKALVKKKKKKEEFAVVVVVVIFNEAHFS